MKKNRLMQELNRELDGVRVSGNLKQRILAEAAASRAPSRRKSFSVRPLAIAAAVMVVCGLTAGMIALRQEKPDLSASTLSAAKVKTTQEMVWVRLPEGLYHAARDCEKVQDPVSMQLETARAAGLKGCSHCIESGSAIADDLVWMTSSGMYYHSVKDCSGMVDAVGVLELEAKTLGHFACPVCLDGEVVSIILPTEEAPSIEITPMPRFGEPSLLNEENTVELPEATWTPTTPEPTLTPMATVEPMQMAQPTPSPMATFESTLPPMATTTPPPVQMAQSTPTPMAMVEPTQPPVSEQGMLVSISEDGYYHADTNCSDHGGVAEFTVKEAVVAGCLPCEACVERTVWISEESDSWHLAKNCSGIENAMAYVLMPGEQMDLPGCLTCMAGGFPVWMSDSHASYHWDENCFNLNDPAQVMESVAAEAGKNPCGICMSIPTVEASEGSDAVVWISRGGYYHWDENCPRAADAQSCTEHEAIGYGKVSCPDCSEQQTETEEMSVWMTKGGIYYHVDEHCSGMENALQVMESEAQEIGKQTCPVCLNVETVSVSEVSDSDAAVDEETFVWATENGVFYHTNEKCSGMNGAEYIAKNEAIESGKMRCAVCMKNTVWVSDENVYYHIARYCSGMKDAVTASEQEALDVNKAPCPGCVLESVQSAEQTETDSDSVWWHPDDTRYYHSDAYCGSTIFTVAEARGQSKAACAVCAENVGDDDFIWIGMDNHFHLDKYCTERPVYESCAESEAIESGRTPCVLCMNYVWETDNGKFYHSEQNCSGMQGAHECAVLEALEDGKQPCSVCMEPVVSCASDAGGGRETSHHAESEEHH